MSRGALIIGLAVLGGAVLVALGVKSLVEEDEAVYQVPSESMKPTYSAGELIAVDRDVYDERDPAIGDVITFYPPAGADGYGPRCGVKPERGMVCPEPTSAVSEQIFFKRIVALEGDELYIEDGVAVVNGTPLEEDYIRPCRGGASCNFPAPITIPPDHVFVLGDNRGASDDSRFWGPLPVENIDGLVVE